MEARKSTNYTISLPPELVETLDEVIEGRYSSRSAAIAEGIRDLIAKLRRRSLTAK